MLDIKTQAYLHVGTIKWGNFMQSMYEQRTGMMIGDRLHSVTYFTSNMHLDEQLESSRIAAHIVNKALIIQMESGKCFRFILGMEFDQYGLDVVIDNRHDAAYATQSHIDMSSTPCWERLIGQQIINIEYGWQQTGQINIPNLYTDYLRLTFQNNLAVIICLPDYPEDVTFSWDVCEDIMVMFDEAQAMHHLAEFGRHKQ